MSFATMNMSSSADQTQTNNRKSALKTCLEDVTILEEENYDNMVTIHKTKEIIAQVDSLYSEISIDQHNSGESYLDSQVLCALSLLAIRCAESASGNINKYDKHELAEHISLNPDFWEFKLPYEAAPVTYLHGTFAAQPLEIEPKAPRKRVERQAAAALKVPDNIANIKKKDDATVMVQRVQTFVGRASVNGPLSYFKVALDPTSFSKSVENIYYLSFLVRNGELEVFIDDQTGLPHIKPRSRKKKDSDIVEKQFIVSINIKLWRDLTKVLNIKEPMMVIERN